MFIKDEAVGCLEIPACKSMVRVRFNDCRDKMLGASMQKENSRETTHVAMVMFRVSIDTTTSLGSCKIYLLDCAQSTIIKT